MPSPSLNIYDTNEIKNIACNYAQALYRCIPNQYRTQDILSICEDNPVNDTPHETTEDVPLAWQLNEILEILPDFIFAWGDDWEPENNMIKDVLGGPLDKPSDLICPVSGEPGWSGDAAYLRQMIAYYKHLITARTYYIDICAASKLYTSYRMYIDSLNPTPGPSWDWSSAINLTMDDETVLSNVFSPNSLLSYWKETSSLIGPTFAQWLWGRYIGTYGPETQLCADNLDIFDAIVPFMGVQDIFNINSSDSWFTSYSINAPVSPNLGISVNAIDVAEKRYITTNVELSPPVNIPAYRMLLADVWYPFIHDPNLQNQLVNFSETIFYNVKYGPTVIQGTNKVCQPIGACCINNDCVDYLSECQCNLLTGTFQQDAQCDTDICLTPTPTVSLSFTPTPTQVVTQTPTLTLSQTAPILSPTQTNTPSNTMTNTQSITPSITATYSPTASVTNSLTLTPTVTTTLSNSLTPTMTLTNSFTPTYIVSPSATTTPTNFPTPTPSSM